MSKGSSQLGRSNDRKGNLSKIVKLMTISVLMVSLKKVLVNVVEYDSSSIHLKNYKRSTVIQRNLDPLVCP